MLLTVLRGFIQPVGLVSLTAQGASKVSIPISPYFIIIWTQTETPQTEKAETDSFF